MQERITLDSYNNKIVSKKVFSADVYTSHITISAFSFSRSSQAKTFKIMFSNKIARRFVHCFHIERLGNMPRKISHKKRSKPVHTDKVAIFAHSCRKTCRKTRWLFLDGTNGNIVVRKRIKRAQQLVFASFFPFCTIQFETYHLPTSMNT